MFTAAQRSKMISVLESSYEDAPIDNEVNGEIVDFLDHIEKHPGDWKAFLDTVSDNEFDEGALISGLETYLM